MLILGLLLVVLSAAVAVVLIAFNTGGMTENVSAFGWDIADVNLMQAFIAGLVVAALFLIGLSMIMKAGRRGRQNRARYKEARREAKSAAAERDELAERLHQGEGQPTAQQPMTSQQPMQGQPMQGQQMQGQPMQGQAMEGQPMQGQPMQGQTVRATQPPAGQSDATGARHAVPEDQSGITNLRPGQSPSR